MLFTRCVCCGGRPIRLTSRGPMCLRATAILNMLGEATKRKALAYRWDEKKKRGVLSSEFFDDLFPLGEPILPQTGAVL